MRAPSVLSDIIHVREVDPVGRATVGATFTKQTVDECLLKPETRGEELKCCRKYKKIVRECQHGKRFAQ